jgi:RHS repeat-associated protein
VEASDKFEAMLQRGEPLLGTEAPWLSQQQEFANLLPFKQEGSVAVPMPNFPRIPGPHMPVLPRMGPLTPEEIDQMAGMPPDPQDAVLLSQGISRAQVNAANQALIEQHLREEHGPVYVPPLHVDHDWLAKHATKTANGFVVTKDFDGSIREMTDSSGNIVAEYSYDPWGVPTKISGSGPTPDFLFQGMFYHQPSGKYLTVFRAYDPSIGRWISREPLGEDAGTNLYTFVGNNPLSYRDPLGLYFVYWGSPNGRAAAESQVNDLGNQPGTGPLVQDLQSSPVPVIIAAEYNQSVFGNSTSPITSPIFSGESAGSIIRYNPFMQPSDNDALSHFKGCPARNSLAHELGHAWNLAHGIDEPHTRPPLFAVPPEGMTPGFERFPMIMEGADRLNLGLPSRGPYIESGGPFYAPGYSHGRF